MPTAAHVRATSLSKHRLELLTDAVLAIVMTIMVLDLRTPLSSGLAGWIRVGPSLLLYVIGFVIIVMGIIIHHDYFAHFREISRAMLWGNFVFVFFVTLVPLLLRAIAAHPGDSFDVALLPVDVLIAGLGLAAMRVRAAREHHGDPGFLDWYRHRRRNSLWAAPLLLLAAGLSYVSVYLTLGVFTIFAIGFVATF
jgi:TMEM175 potassium channel family protein